MEENDGNAEIDKNTDCRYDLGRMRRAVPACGALFPKAALFIWSGAGRLLCGLPSDRPAAGNGAGVQKKTAEGAERIHKLRLTLYLRGLFLPEAFDGEQKAHILAQFLQTAAEEGQQLAYPRSYTEQEQAFYGWKNQPVAEWDLSKRIEPSSPPRFSGEIDAESFDGLALWHILSGRLSRDKEKDAA